MNFLSRSQACNFFDIKDFLTVSAENCDQLKCLSDQDTETLQINQVGSWEFEQFCPILHG